MIDEGGRADLDSAAAQHIFAAMPSATSDLRRRLRAEQSVPRFDPCLPRPASEPPAGPGWIHEIKHDGFRILAHRRGRTVRLFSRNGHNFADRFPLIAEAIEALPVRSCVVDGEAIVCGDGGLAVFELIRARGATRPRCSCAFDLLEVNGEDIRREPIEDRKRRLAGRYGSRMTVSPPTSTSAVTALSSTSTRARSAARASCRSGSARRSRRPIGALVEGHVPGVAGGEARGGGRMALSDDAAIYVDAGRPATLNDGAGAQTDCRTLQEAVSAWLALPSAQKTASRRKGNAPTARSEKEKSIDAVSESGNPKNSYREREREDHAWPASFRHSASRSRSDGGQ